MAATAALVESFSVPRSCSISKCWKKKNTTMLPQLTLSPINKTAANSCCRHHVISCEAAKVPRRNALALMLSSVIIMQDDSYAIALTPQSVVLREYIDSFDGYSFKYPKNWIQVRGAGADIFFRDPFILDENLSVDISSPSSSSYKSVEDLGSPQAAGERVLKQYLTEFMSTRLGVRRESSICSTSSRVADDGKVYYQVEVNIKSYANNNELAVMPENRIARLEWDRRYLSVLGVENKQLYQLRLQTPENVYLEEEKDIRQIMDSFRVFKVSA
ncbi:Psbp-domain protein [Thalictrum thalictroides]|uniref:Psbp-domain protein n=1 Tax=Thalictrum thalictroides TaxID=46969 RepID=A0A7J6WA06_THATH|nr:Psbp-domain protein [Thalictrum thalictroides]